MKRKLLVSAIAAASIGSAANAQTFWEKVTWVPTAGVQMKTLSFDQDLDSGGNPKVSSADGDFDIDMPVLSLGLTAIYDRFYVGLKFDNSFDDATGSSDVPFTNAPTAVSREDLSITFGMNVVERLNVFLGYMDGETLLRPEPTVSGNTASAQDSVGGPSYEQTYQEDGFFIGTSYGLPIKEIGTLSFSLAYAFMDGTYEDNFSDAILGPGFNFEYEGDSEGVSLGATWSAPLTERVGYYFDLRFQQYDMDADDANGNFVGSEVDTEEQMLTYSAGVQWYF